MSYEERDKIIRHFGKKDINRRVIQFFLYKNIG